MLQTTLQRSFTCSGIGLHSGKPVSVTCHPAPANTGIVFMVETPEGFQRVTLGASAVMATELATTLGNGKASVSTVEHLLAALRGLGIDNVEVRAQSEIPILDGSAAEFAARIAEVGTRHYNVYRKVLRVTKPVELRDGRRYICAYPVNTPGAFRVNYFIDFPHPVIGQQQFSLDVTPAKFQRVATSRTFGFLRDVEYLRSKGLARGGSMDNAIVLDDTRVLNPDGLQRPDEFVRHKVLDFIGDMGMAPLPLQGNFTVACSGHQFNNVFLHKLEEENALEELVLADPESLSRQSPMSHSTYASPLAGGLALA